MMVQMTRAELYTAFAGISFLAAAVGGGIIMSAYDPGMNQGGEPSSKTHPDGDVNSKFQPHFTMLLHMEIMPDLSIKATRVQFPTNGKEWADVKTLTTTWINQANNATLTEVDSPSLVIKHGIRNFYFNQPHHFVIYIKNPNILYHGKYPVWFGSRLIGNNGDPANSEATENRSFFAASPEDVSGLNPSNVSHKVVYMKNFWKRKRWHGGYDDIEMGVNGRKIYSLNINTILNITKPGGTDPIAIPVIIDPDTGNMGGGNPTQTVYR